MTRQLLFIIVAICFFLALAGIAIYFSRRSRLAANADIASVLEKLQAIDREKIAMLAQDLFEDDAAPDLDHDEIWNLVGGMRGLEALHANCEVLIELAFVVQQAYPEALPITEELRRNAREIQFHVDRLKGAAQTGHLRAYFPDYAQRVAATYLKMSQSVLHLYSQTAYAALPTLRAAI